jgi:hypothetical protein
MDGEGRVLACAEMVKAIVSKTESCSVVTDSTLPSSRLRRGCRFDFGSEGLRRLICRVIVLKDGNANHDAFRADVGAREMAGAGDKLAALVAERALLCGLSHAASIVLRNI